MTCREKLELTNSDMSEDTFAIFINDECPDRFFNIDVPDWCNPNAPCPTCDRCWDRELTDETPKAEMKNSEGAESAILDSGDRTQFESGAVRDMHAGKGRFDVMPLEVISDMLGTKEVNHDPIMLDIATFMYEHDTAWLEAALDNFATAAYDGCLYSMFLDVAKHYEEGAIKYDPNNWRRGIPVWCYIDSATRHYMKWRRGDSDEHHERAFVWNLMCCIWEVDYGEQWRKDQEVVK